MKKSVATPIRNWGRTCGFLAALAAGLALSAPANADSHGHGGFHHDHFHGRGFLGFGGFGPFWPYYDPYFYPYPAYNGPPYYYGPPYYPAPYAAPAPAAISPQVNCIKFNGDATNDQTGQPFYGTACMQADGKWHIVGN
ncbi:MAG: hypothetical protein WAN51_02405 [Alphaproteobacteria bacterium]